jgi:hypothetical protein
MANARASAERAMQKRTECRLELRTEADAEVAAACCITATVSEVVRGHCANLVVV